MNKPYIILHMLMSIDGKVTGDYMNTKVSEALCEEYYRINRQYNADAFVCGRVTMEGSFTGGAKPDLTPFSGTQMEHEDFVAKQADYYAVSIDPHGKLGWSDSEIHDSDPGYDNAHIIEVLTDDVQDEYLAFLKSKGISFIFCGKNELDAHLLNDKLFNLFGIKTLMLEGGGITDGLFFNSETIDELSLVVVPLVDGSNGVELFENKNVGTQSFKLEKSEVLPNDGLWLNYKKR